MFERWKILLVMLLLAAGSAWLLQVLSPGKARGPAQVLHQPDYYLHNFVTVNMEEDGTLKNRLEADYMAHYPDDDTTELVKPRLSVTRPGQEPVQVTADKGWVTADNKVILLSGSVNLWQLDESGNKRLEIITSEVKILTDEEYAETEKPATISGRDTTVNATGVRAWLKEGRLQLLSNVHTTISSQRVD